MELTITRSLNALLSGFSYLYGSLSGSPLIWGMPPAVSVELTNTCNLRCPECATGSDILRRKKGFMDPHLLSKILDELKPYLYYLSLYFQGEPMLHPGFFSFLEEARGIRKIVSTNGNFLSPENAEKLTGSDLYKLIVSLDGTDQDSYLKYRKGGDIAKVLGGIRNVAEAKSRTRSKMKLELQFLVNKYNEHQINDAMVIARESGATMKLKSMQIISHSGFEEWIPADPKYSRYQKEEDKYLIKSTLPNRCLRLYLNPVIAWDGKVVPCCFDKDANYIMGDLSVDSFRNIWNGERYASFRKRILTERNKIEICRNCTSGLNSVKY